MWRVHAGKAPFPSWGLWALLAPAPWARSLCHRPCLLGLGEQCWWRSRKLHIISHLEFSLMEAVLLAEHPWGKAWGSILTSQQIPHLTLYLTVSTTWEFFQYHLSFYQITIWNREVFGFCPFSHARRHWHTAAISLYCPPFSRSRVLDCSPLESAHRTYAQFSLIFAIVLNVPPPSFALLLSHFNLFIGRIISKREFTCFLYGKLT